MNYSKNSLYLYKVNLELLKIKPSLNGETLQLQHSTIYKDKNNKFQKLRIEIKIYQFSKNHKDLTLKLESLKILSLKVVNQLLLIILKIVPYLQVLTFNKHNKESF